MVQLIGQQRWQCLAVHHAALLINYGCAHQFCASLDGVSLSVMVWSGRTRMFTFISLSISLAIVNAANTHTAAQVLQQNFRVEQECYLRNWHFLHTTESQS